MNFCRNGVKTASLAVLVFSVIIGVSVSQVSAQTGGMSVNVDAEQGSSTISISGQTDSLLNDISIIVTSPSGNVVSIDQVSPEISGEYMADIQIGSLWKQSGIYTISIQQGDSARQMTIPVEISDGATMETSVSKSLPGLGRAPMVSYDEGGLKFTADAPEGAVAIGIDGNTDRINTDVVLVVKAPNGNIVSIDQITPDQDGDFSTVIGVGCPTWKQDGFYTITARQGDPSFYNTSVEVEILDCVIVPEFGTVAALILAVAIVSIVAMTARSRLSIAPKF